MNKPHIFLLIAALHVGSVSAGDPSDQASTTPNSSGSDEVVVQSANEERTLEERVKALEESIHRITPTPGPLWAKDVFVKTPPAGRGWGPVVYPGAPQVPVYYRDGRVITLEGQVGELQNLVKVQTEILKELVKEVSLLRASIK